MSFIVVGTLSHSLFGAALAFLLRTKWSAIYVSLIFFAKEFGELKYKIPGSIKTWGKNVEILQTLFTDINVLVQWFVPGLVALGIHLYFNRRKA